MDLLSRLTTKGKIEEAMNRLPHGLYDTYSRILDGIPPEQQEIVSNALRWLAYSPEPFGLPELVQAISIDEDSHCLDDMEQLTIPEDVYEFCGSLVRPSPTSGMPELAHHSVFEFLTSGATRSHVPEAFRLSEAESYIILFKACIGFLSFPEFSSSESGLQSESQENLADPLVGTSGIIQTSPFYHFAVQNWFKFLSRNYSIDEIWPKLSIFLDEGVGNLSSCLTVLRYLQGSYKFPFDTNAIHLCATLGLPSVFSRIISKTSLDINATVKDGRTALHMAVENSHMAVASSHVNIVQLLLANGAQVLRRSLHNCGEIGSAVCRGERMAASREITA
jgi:Ankyrin repeats (3 copies)